MDPNPFYLSLKLAATTMVLLLFFGALIAYTLVFIRIPGKSFFEALINLPLVLPPTVLGFYLLLAMGPNGGAGQLWEKLFGSPLLFTFTGIVIASVIQTFPFAVFPMKAAFKKIDRRLIENAEVLGLPRLSVFFRVIVPNSLPGIATSAILVFLHAIGEFGVILMVGGSMPGKTKVISIAIYEAVEALRYRDACLMSLILIPVCYIFLLATNYLSTGAHNEP